MTERSTTDTRPADWYTSTLISLPAQAAAPVFTDGVSQQDAVAAMRRRVFPAAIR